jgi:hypothetical protein
MQFNLKMACSSRIQQLLTYCPKVRKSSKVVTPAMLKCAANGSYLMSF